MKKRMRVTGIAICALMICLAVMSVMAAYHSTTATINTGSTYVESTTADLNLNRLYGYVSSTSGYGSGLLYGSMWTFRIFGPYLRGYDSVSVGNTSSTYYWDPNGTGYFFSVAEAPSANHNGFSRAYQY